MTKLKALWAALPHPVQALIVAFITAAGTAFFQAISENLCFTVACLKHEAYTAVIAGIAAARAFYMVPNKPAPKPAPLPTQEP